MVFHRHVGERFLVYLLYVKMILFQIVTWLDFAMCLSKRRPPHSTCHFGLTAKGNGKYNVAVQVENINWNEDIDPEQKNTNRLLILVFSYDLEGSHYSFHLCIGHRYVCADLLLFFIVPVETVPSFHGSVFF